MGFWNKLGKIALTAAPYVAAPFTGGASLMATGAANKAVQKWSESDAKKNIAKGLAPSKFDAALGKIGGIAGMASSFVNPSNALMNLGTKGSVLAKIGTGALTGSDGGWKGALLGAGLGATPGIGPSGSKLSKLADFGKEIGTRYASGMGSQGNEYTGGNESQGTAMGRSASDVVSNSTRRAPDNKSIGSTLGDRDELRRYEGISSGKHPITPSLMGNPDLYTSLRAGSRAAVQDQGFRKGYDVRTTDGGDPEVITTSKMPKISASYARYANQQNPRRQAQANAR